MPQALFSELLTFVLRPLKKTTRIRRQSNRFGLLPLNIFARGLRIRSKSGLLQVVSREGCRAARFKCVVLLFAIRTAFRLVSVDMIHQIWGTEESKRNRSAPDGKSIWIVLRLTCSRRQYEYIRSVLLSPSILHFASLPHNPLPGLSHTAVIPA